MSLRLLAAACFVVLAAFAAAPTQQLFAQSTTELEAAIDDSQSAIDTLRNEIAQLQRQLTDTSKQKQTLQTAIKTIDLNIQSLQKSISLTNAQISQKDKQIKNLSGSISDTGEKISVSQAGVAQSLRDLDALDQDELVTTWLASGTLSSFFDQVVTLGATRGDLQNFTDKLNELKAGLQTDKSSAEQKRTELARLQAQLSQQKQSLAAARVAQNDLLTQTKNQESSYQSLIAQKKAQQAKFEADLLAYQAKLGLSVTPGSIPAARAGVLSWPVSTVRITQYFGNTDFSTKNPQIYNGHGHTGMDFGVPTGTPIKAALNGVVLGTGNTDATCPNASYGKWVFIKHPNGLSTLYAHLSTISVSKGESVSTGQVVGYSGSTGYATGPHLHFGVYASSGSEISSFASASCKGKIYTMPVGDISAYLNPLSYLPAL